MCVIETAWLSQYRQYQHSSSFFSRRFFLFLPNDQTTTRTKTTTMAIATTHKCTRFFIIPMAQLVADCERGECSLWWRNRFLGITRDIRSIFGYKTKAKIPKRRYVSQRKWMPSVSLSLSLLRARCSFGCVYRHIRKRLIFICLLSKTKYVDDSLFICFRRLIDRQIYFRSVARQVRRQIFVYRV